VDVNAQWTPVQSLTLTGGYSYLDTEANQYDEEDQVMKHVIIDGMAHHRATVSAIWTHAWRRSNYHLGIGVMDVFRVNVIIRMMEMARLISLEAEYPSPI
jgi:outer membrane receptor for ferrienterochelin and colicins